MPRLNDPFATLMSRVLKNEKTGCWEYQGSRDPSGYGRFGSGKYGEIMAHRYSWVKAHGPIPKGLCVLHKCDVRNCINPDHLFLGTQQDNIRDMVAKGRNKPPKIRRGADHHNAVMSADHVWMIRHMVRLKWFTQAEVARSYGVSHATISLIVNRKNWSHVHD